MDEIIKRVEEITKPVHIGYRNMAKVNISVCAFADDIVLLGNNKKELEEKLNAWHTVLISNGMRMNLKKTKTMVFTKENIKIDVRVNGESIQQVDEFKYLGVILGSTGSQEADINNRIQGMNKSYFPLSKIFTNKKEIRKETKTKIYQTICRPILIYGSETWTLSQSQKSKIRAAEMRVLRRIYGATRLDRVRSADIRESLGIEAVETHIERRQLGWWGHLQRMDRNMQVRAIYDARMQGKRNQRGQRYHGIRQYWAFWQARVSMKPKQKRLQKIA